MDVLLSIVFGLACLVVTIFVIGRWIFSPIDRRGESRDAPLQFSISDILCLFVILQIPLIASHFLGTNSVIEEEQRSFWMITIIAWVIAPIIWFTCARALSKADIRNGRHRLIFLGLILPFVYYALIPFLFLTGGSIGWLFSREDPQDADPSVWVVVTWSGLACTFFLCGLLTRRIVRLSQESTSSN
jgi:hypothetical protein